MSSKNKIERVQRLASLASDGQLDRKQEEELAGLLEESADLRKAYVAWVANDSVLQRVAAKPVLERALGPHIAHTRPTVKSVVGEAGPTPPGATKNQTLPRWLDHLSLPEPMLSWIPSRTWQVAALLLIAIALASLSGIDSITGQPMAMVVSVEDAVWDGDSTIGLGEVLHHETLSLKSGVAKLYVGDSWWVSLHGPTRIKVVNRDKIELAEGEVSVHGDDGARGFVVSSPRIEVEDLGTAFLVSSRADGQESVQVTNGSVRVRSRSLPMNGPRSVEVEAGERCRVASADKSGHQFVVSRVFEQLQMSGSAKFYGLHPMNTGRDPRHRIDAVQVFLESSSRRLPVDLPVNLARPGTYTRFGREAAVIPAGTIVDTYLLHTGMDRVKSGSVTFPGRILGVISDSGLLNSTNGIFGAAWTLQSHSTNRGLESGLNADRVIISEDQKTVSVTFRTAAAYDQMRVLVATENQSAESSTP